MSRFDRCDEQMSRATPSTASRGMAAIGIRLRMAMGLVLVGPMACRGPAIRADDEAVGRAGTPATAAGSVASASEIQTADDPQMSLVPSEASFAALQNGILDPMVFADAGSGDGSAPSRSTPSTPSTLSEASPIPAGPVAEAINEADPIEIEVVTDDVEVAPDLRRIQSMLRHLASEADDPVPYHLAASMLPVIGIKGAADAEPDPFLALESDLDGEEAAMLDEVAAFATGLRTRIDAGESTRTVLIEELEGLLDRLERGSRLTIAVAELCREVRGAGDYELLPRVFASGRPQEVLVYVDLNGEEWTEIEGGEWEWAVDWKLELHQVSDRSIADRTDWNRQRTRRAYPVDDNYLLIRYTIPAEDLASALYVLKIRFREPGTNRETETGIQFQLVPRRAIAVQGT